MAPFPSDQLTVALTIPPLLTAAWVAARLWGVHRRVDRLSDDQTDAHTSRLLFVIGLLWTLTQLAVTVGLAVIPRAFGERPILREGSDRAMFDARSWLFVFIGYVSAAGGLLFVRWMNCEMRGGPPYCNSRPANP